MNENKPLLLFMSPLKTTSGYGQRSRDLLKALIDSDKYDIKAVSTMWGGTPHTGLDLTNPDHIKMNSLILETLELPRKPDIFIQVTVPNEFQPIGNFNIGITAGIETTVCDPSWIEGCNRMDLILTSSEHSKNVFTSSNFEKKNKETNHVEGIVKLEKPIEVLFEGVNLDIFKKLSSDEFKSNNLTQQLGKIKEDFCYLFVGHWLNGDLGSDRKDVGMLIKTFCETFKKKSKKPALILKTSAASFSIMDREEILSKIEAIKNTINGVIGDFPGVYVLHGNLSDSEMNELYNHKKVKAHISFTKGEGFGRPLLEASISAKPVLASDYSGHKDFLSKFSIMLPGKLNPIHSSAVWEGVLNSYSQWFTVNYGYASQVMKNVFDKYEMYLDKAKQQAYYSRTNFSFDLMKSLLLQYIDKYYKDVPKFKSIVLPNLNRVKLPEIKVEPNKEQVNLDN